MNLAYLEATGLKKYFAVRTGMIRRKTLVAKAVDGIDIAIRKGEIFGLVGESGSGKTTVGKMLLRLIEPSDGRILLDGRNMLEATEDEMRVLRRYVQMIFQDTDASLNPRRSIRQTLGLPFLIHEGRFGKEELEAKVLELLEKVELEPADKFIDRYPHELSGGQKQRVGIARAIAINPCLIVADEPVSSLDVSVRGQILKLLKRLKQENGLAYLFITHDLAVVRTMADTISIMYSGKIVESGTAQKILEYALHPYTQSLLLSTPIPKPDLMRKRELLPIKGEIPSPTNLPSGCRFHTRCPYAESICSEAEPELLEAEGGHLVACHLVSKGRIRPTSVSHLARVN